MKKLTLIISALALVLGLSQCTKRPNVPNYIDGKRIEQHVTLNASYNDGAKVSLMSLTQEMKLQWDGNEVIYVYDGTALCGKLEFSGYGADNTTANFEGNINPVAGSTLRFYNFNGVAATGVPGTAENPTGTLTRDYPTQAFTNVNDIINELVLVAESPISQDGSYNLTMGLPFAVVKVVFDGFGTANIDLNNVAATGFTVNNKGELSTYQSANKIILTAPGTTDHFIVLMPNSVENTLNFHNDNGNANKNWGIEANKYYTSSFSTTGESVIVASYNDLGVYTVDASGNKVIFSPANLQYQASTGTWRFATKQWQYLANPGYTDINGTVYNSGNATAVGTRETQDLWIDLFGWGTSGWSGCGNTHYQPTATNGDEGDPSIGYGYGPYNGTTTKFDLTGTYANSDWGVYNDIYNPLTNSFDTKGTWRCFTAAEMDYILNSRTDTYRFGRAKLYGKYGLVLFPDGYNGVIPTVGIRDINTGEGGHYPSGASQSIPAADWAAMEKAGCVFMPCGSRRDVLYVADESNKYGLYWSSSHNPGYNKYAWALYFNGDNGEGQHLTAYSNERDKCRGYAVRLVRPTTSK